MKGSIIFLTATALATAADLGTKAFAASTLKHANWPAAQNPPVTLIPGFLDLVWNQNQGAAFGILRGQFWVFIAISLVAVAALAYFSAVASKKDGWGYQAVLGMLTAGVLGNLYDRVALGYVRDFIDMYAGYRPLADKLVGWFGTNHWPTYNFADAFICVGAVGLLVKFWRDDRRERREAKAAASAAEGAKGEDTGKAKAKAPSRG